MEGLVKPLGLLMLDTQFERVLGDVGHPDTFDFPVIHRVIRGASAQQVVLDDPKALLPAFIEAGRDLIAQGAAGIGTSCGFLGQFQRELSQVLSVPIASSALQQVPWVKSLLPTDAQVGIITISAAALDSTHFEPLNTPLGTPIVGLDEGESQTLIDCLVHGKTPRLDPQLAARELVAAGIRLITKHPKVRAIVLECTNLPPYAYALKEATTLPVYDVNTMLRWFHAGL